MKCPQCTAETSDGSKFCSVCGSSLVRLCPACKHANSPGSRYCSACGNLIVEPVPSEPAARVEGKRAGLEGGERRRATVVFSDISGYTALSERLDPEDVSRFLELIRQTAFQVVQKHGGTINQFIGDEVMTVFGIPNAREDDAIRAIKTALELHSEIRARTKDLQDSTSERLAVHTGISTGLIMAQYRDDREGLYQLTGDAVNTAARLRALAEFDEVLIGPATLRLVKPYFDIEGRPPVSVKGKAAPLFPYRVIKESRIGSRFDAALERGFRRYIGRSREVDTLRACLARALEGEGQLVTVEGEPGIGKSRLLYEFLGGLDREQVTVPQGRCQPYAGDIPYFPFLDSLRRSLHLSEHDSQAESLQKAVSTIRWIDPSLEKFLPLLLHVLSIPSEYSLPADLKGEALRRAMEEALVAIITLTAKIQPMVLVIEDWHWSDPASQSALIRLLRLVPSHRLLVIVSYRSEYKFDFGTIARATAVRLNSLNEAETTELIRSVTGSSELPAGLGPLVCQSTDGNPLFIEEVCYSLLESGAVSVSDRRLALHQPLQRLLLPDTVEAVIRARLDRLDEAASAIVQHASVIGRTFGYQLLARISKRKDTLAEALDTLQSQGIIRQTRALPEPEYSFRHVLTREVAYDTLLQEQRKQLHEMVGLAIEEFQAERLGEHAAVLAHHYARSARGDKAVRFALLAGERAAELYANAEAATYFSDALAAAKSIPQTPEGQRWQIDAIVGLAAASTGPHDMKREQENLLQAYALADRLGDRRRLTQILYWLGRHHYVLAELEQAIDYGERSLRFADELGDAKLAAPPVNLMGRAYSQLSDIVKSARMMERSVEQMRVLGNKGEQSTAAGFLSALLGYLGNFEKAMSYSDSSIALARDAKSPFAEAASFHYRGGIRDQQGDWDAALADYDAALKIAQAAGDPFRLYIVRFMEGRARHMAGDPVGGFELIEGSISLGAKIGTEFMLGQAKSFLAACCLDTGDIERARSLSREALDLAEKTRDKFTKALALRVTAEIISRTPRGDLHEAKQLMSKVIRILEEMEAKPELARSHATFALILNVEGKADEAARHRDDAMRQFAALGMSWDVARTVRTFERGP